MDAQKKFDESESERQKLSAKFEQARLLARRYRMKSQTLEKDVEGLKAVLAEKTIKGEESTAKLKQELLSLRAEIEKQKQQVIHFFFLCINFLKIAGSSSQVSYWHV